jgi:hypothetical protein
VKVWGDTLGHVRATSGGNICDRKVPGGLLLSCIITIYINHCHASRHLCQPPSCHSHQLVITVLVTWREDIATVDCELQTTTWCWQDKHGGSSSRQASVRDSQGPKEMELKILMAGRRDGLPWRLGGMIVTSAVGLTDFPYLDRATH